VSNQTAFGTYQRDVRYGGTFDYAMNRYYAPQWGRFTTPDPYQASAQFANPQSWNRYSYVENDPVNYTDSSGLKADFSATGYCYGCLGPSSFSGQPDYSFAFGWGVGFYMSQGHVWMESDMGWRLDGDTTRANSDALTLASGILDANARLALPDCAELFSGKGYMSALGVKSGQELLSLYLQQGWLTAGTTFVPNGGGAPQTFASLGGNALTNTGGVTTVANASYTNAGTTVSVSRIALNTDSFVFTGFVWGEGGAIAVGAAAPAAFGGMTQPQITGAAIIHELLHAIRAIPSDAGKPNQSLANSALVKEKCY
jgi:RHS repeat-associated protein